MKRHTAVAGLLATMLGIVFMGLVLAQGRSAVTQPHDDTAAIRQENLSVLADPKASPAAIAGVEMRARALVEHEPLNSTGYAILALHHEKIGKKVEAGNLMRAAARFNRRDGVADIWLFQNLVETGHFDEAFLHADALMRREHGRIETIFPIIVGSLQNETAIDALGKRLSGNPPWRAPFMDVSFRMLKQPDAGATLLGAIKRAGGSISSSELSPIINVFVTQNAFDQAYLHWLLYSPEEVLAKSGNVIDGDFNSLAYAAPFGWTIRPPEANIDTAASYGRREPALHIEASALKEPLLAQQLLVLTPGRYRLSGDVLTATHGSFQQTRWSLVCAKTSQPIASTSSPDTNGGWRRFSVQFSISDDCPAQWLQLDAADTSQPALVDTWYDKIAIDRLEAAS